MPRESFDDSPRQLLLHKETSMKKNQHTIECGRCGETRVDYLTQEEARMLDDATGPIYRQCERCGKTTGWINSTRPTAAMPETMPDPIKVKSLNDRVSESRPLKGQERMATQDERDSVNSMAIGSGQSISD